MRRRRFGACLRNISARAPRRLATPATRTLPRDFPMSMLQLQPLLAAYWSAAEVTTNVIVFFNLLGALLLGSLVGYERSYHGRAAGMRTYGLVCMAAAGLTVMAGFPQFWYGGGHGMSVAPDPTRVVQGIVTGVGFLGAGVIVKEGLNISGLTTAASIWSASCIGILVGVGFYASAILLAGMSAATMMWGSRLEARLPTRHAVAMTLRFKPGFVPESETIVRFALGQGYELARGSLSIVNGEGRSEWRCVVVVIDRATAVPLDALARALPQLDGVVGFSLAHARN
jgi:putative Mg2+ transporter-C (MgtC) family protein